MLENNQELVKFVPNPDKDGRYCRGNGHYDLERYCQKCEYWTDCYCCESRLNDDKYFWEE